MIHAIQKHGQKGFTLVEVIVVAVIVAALAGVAVPVYLGYVGSSRLNAATNTAGAVASFMGSCKNATGNLAAAYPATLNTDGEVAPGPITLTCTIAGMADLPTVAIPQGIVVTHHGVAGAAGANITAHHVDNAGQESNPYSY